MIHHATFLKLWETTTGAAQFTVQNFYQNGTITVSGDQYQFLDFQIGEMVATSGSADQSELTITLPGLTAASTALTQGLSEGWLATVTVYRFVAATPPMAPPAGQTIILQPVGEVIGGSEEFPSGVTLLIGSALESLGAQVPPRRFTSSLVGTPCRL